MKFATWTVLLVGLAATCLAGVPQGQQKPSVYGKVTDPTNTPVRGVEVTARNISTNETKSVTTDEHGHYEFSDLSDGEYRLNFKRDGFQRGERQASVRADHIPVVVDKILRPAPTETGGLRGVVKDPDGAAVSGATVTAINQQTGAALTGTTDADGFYHLVVPAGSYRLEVEAKGFKKSEIAVVVTPSQASSVEVALVPGPVTEAITIAVGAPLIDEATPLGQTVFHDRQIAELPLQRDVTFLTTLSPDVTKSPGGASINGGRPDQTNISLDGMDNNDRSVSGNVAEGRRPGLPLEAIREVSVDPGLASGLDRNSDFAAEQGRGSGGTVSVVTKSGTNELHGSAFYFHRNSRLDARDFFETRKSPSRTHQFGLAVGGPVVKDQTFFFGGYEGHRELDSRPRLVSVPSPSRLTSARALLAADGLTENPLSDRLLRLFPQPDRARDFQNRAVNSPAISDSDAFQIRFDHKFNSRNYAVVRYNFSRSEQSSPLAPSFFPGFRADSSGREQILFASLSSVLPAGRSNEALFSYRRNRYRFSPEDSAFDPASVGLNTGVTDPERFGLPFIRITGFDALGAPPNLPGHETATTWQLKDQFTGVIGRATFTVGAALSRVFSNSLNEAGTRGRIFFDGSVLGDPLADFLAGLPSGDTGILRGDTQRGIAINYASGFAQADIRPNNRLTLNAGLRYEFNGLPGEEQNRLSNFVPELGGLLPVGAGGLPKLYRNDLNNFAPRVGFAWALTGSARAFVRGGWGVFYDAPTTRLFAGLCPCPNSIGQGVTTNPVGPSPVFAVSPSGAIPFAPGQPVFGPAPGPGTPLDIHAVERDLKSPFVQNFNFGLQAESVWGIVLEAAYQGSVGTHLYRTLDINQPTPGDPRTRDSRRPFFALFPQFASINLLTSSARSSYHSLSFSAKRSFARRLGFDAGYSFLKADDDASDANEIPQDSRNLRAERGPSSFGRRHTFVLSWNYDISHTGRGVLDGWQVSGIVRAESGRPFTPVISFDNSGTGTFVDRPSLVGDPSVRGDRTHLYSSSAFRIPPRGTFDNLGRNSLVGPRLNTLDVSLLKRTALWKDRSFELRLDFLDLFNHPNFRLPNPFVDDPAFGRVNATEVYGGHRRIQIGARFSF